MLVLFLIMFSHHEMAKLFMKEFQTYNVSVPILLVHFPTLIPCSCFYASFFLKSFHTIVYSNVTDSVSCLILYLNTISKPVLLL